ncbi:transposase [Actinopolyspora halophila]|uniref:transposase n=1 Tax=Actinopolyspora halophila TaxID=1850 RepID=UPI001B7FCBDD
MLAALDLTAGKIHYRIRDRKRHREFLDLLTSLRARWPGEKLYLVCDTFSPHRHPAVRAWAAANKVELVFLPTYGSWLNWIESPVRRHGLVRIAATPSKTPRSAPISAGATPVLSPRPDSPPTHPSAPGPITRPKLPDNPLGRRIRNS